MRHWEASAAHRPLAQRYVVPVPQALDVVVQGVALQVPSVHRKGVASEQPLGPRHAVADAAHEPSAQKTWPEGHDKVDTKAAHKAVPLPDEASIQLPNGHLNKLAGQPVKSLVHAAAAVAHRPFAQRNGRMAGHEFCNGHAEAERQVPSLQRTVLVGHGRITGHCSALMRHDSSAQRTGFKPAKGEEPHVVLSKVMYGGITGHRYELSAQ
jgi:hypothetical protein